MGRPGGQRWLCLRLGPLADITLSQTSIPPFWSFLLLAQAQTQSPPFPPKDIIPGGTQLRPAEGLADLHICTMLTDVLAHPRL